MAHDGAPLGDESTQLGRLVWGRMLKDVQTRSSGMRQQVAGDP